MQEFISTIPHFHMFATFAIILFGVYLLASEKLPMIVSSMLIICIFLFLFTVIPYENAAGKKLNPDSLLDGFANPALLAVLALLIIGQAAIRTGSLNALSNRLLRFAKGRHPMVAIFPILLMVLLVSGFVNDTPTVVIFMPIMLSVAASIGMSASKVMIPLSYAAILGGITTLVGSSTNLLVSGALTSMGEKALGVFDFTLPGVIIAGVGFIYVAFFLPKMLPKRAPLAESITAGGKQFVAQLQIMADSMLIGKSIRDAALFGEREVGIRLLQRGEHAYLAPFTDDIKIRSGDIMILTATRDVLKSILSEKGSGAFTHSTLPGEDESGESQSAASVLAEILVTPGSRLLGQTIEQVGFLHHYHCIVMGVQRKSRMITTRMTDIRLAAGDVLLVMGNRAELNKLRDNKDMVLMEWAIEDLPSKTFAMRVNLIFASVIGIAAFGLMPIHITALMGAVAVVLAGCLNVRQALRALEAPIIFMVAAGLAMSVALEKTGGAVYLADLLIDGMAGFSPVIIMSALFLLIAIVTNLLSNNATALLFTPIAVNTAHLLNAPLEMFVFAVIFASNCCSVATPISYQTNLLVMGPGHYVFKDYVKAGVPLVILIWITYTLFAWCYF